MPTRSSKATGFMRALACGRSPEIEQLPAMRDQRDLHVLAHRHGRNVAVIWKVCVPNPHPPDHRGFLPVVSLASTRMQRYRGRSGR